jgi:hypothetical protein
VAVVLNSGEKETGKVQSSLERWSRRLRPERFPPAWLALRRSLPPRLATSSYSAADTPDSPKLHQDSPPASPARPARLASRPGSGKASCARPAFDELSTPRHALQVSILLLARREEL